MNAHKFNDGSHVPRTECSTDYSRMNMMFLEAFTQDVTGGHDTITENVSRNDEILKAYEECIWRDARIALPGKTWNQLRTLVRLPMLNSTRCLQTRIASWFLILIEETLSSLLD